MIELTGLSRVYRMGSEDVHALRDVTLTIDAGELHILGCLDRPTRGSYRFDGREIGRCSETELSLIRRNSIGFVFQFFHLLPRLDALANVEVPMVFAGVDRRRRRRRAVEVLESVGLGHRLRHRPEELSGGERQRVAIARAVVMGPRLLLADEPTGNLDRKSAAEIMTLLERMNAEGLTLVVVTHDDEIARRAGRVIRIEDGEIMATGR